MKAILAITLALAAANAQAATLITQTKYKVEMLYYNLVKLPRPMINSDGVAVGEMTAATYKNNVVTYYTTLSWELLEIMRAEKSRVSGLSKAELLETEVKLPMIGPMIAQYCAMSGKLYRLRRDNIMVTYTFDASEFGSFSIVLGETSCGAAT